MCVDCFFLLQWAKSWSLWIWIPEGLVVSQYQRAWLWMDSKHGVASRGFCPKQTSDQWFTSVTETQIRHKTLQKSTRVLIGTVFTWVKEILIFFFLKGESHEKLNSHFHSKKGHFIQTLIFFIILKRVYFAFYVNILLPYIVLILPVDWLRQ